MCPLFVRRWGPVEENAAAVLVKTQNLHGLMSNLNWGVGQKSKLSAADVWATIWGRHTTVWCRVVCAAAHSPGWGAWRQAAARTLSFDKSSVGFYFPPPSYS